MFSNSPFRSWFPATVVVLLIAGAGAWMMFAVDEARAGEKERIEVPRNLVRYDDGDTIDIAWAKGVESVRILGIDTPELQHLEHDLPYAQAFGNEAAGFLRGCLAAAEKVELLRSGNKDRYGRTLGYVFVNGRNYSVLVIEARLSYGPSDRFGDNGLPKEHAACQAAADRAGPPPFEEPYRYRRRMREVSAWMKKQGIYPKGPK